MSSKGLMTSILQFMQTIKDLQSIESLLSWDQETYMPPAAAESRAEQLATLAAQIHSLLTSSTAHQLTKQAEQLHEQLDPESTEARLLQLFIEDVRRANALPKAHVRRLAFLTSEAQVVWRQAREENDFPRFAPYLQQLLELQRATAEYYGYEEHPYDALLDQYEPGMTVAQVQPLFQELKVFLQTVLSQIPNAENGKAQRQWLFQAFPEKEQLRFAQTVIQQLGFTTRYGRIDVSAHPFCTSFSPLDVRLTTRVNRTDFRTCFFSLLHEAGHGMYEQGLQGEYPRTFAISGASMGIHESQSLFWEDIIGRSEAFWQWVLPQLQRWFPAQTSTVTPMQAFRSVNHVEPGLIRIDADELTYHFHIILRFELELQLFDGVLTVSALPEAWNAKMQEYLGIVPPDVANGCLQDIHWSFGGFGYFPTYTLGKLYAAMFWERLQQEIEDVEQQIIQGEFTPILQWLRRHIHWYGRLKKPAEIIHDVCGQSLSTAAFQRYLVQKLESVYNIALEE